MRTRRVATLDVYFFRELRNRQLRNLTNRKSTIRIHRRESNASSVATRRIPPVGNAIRGLEGPRLPSFCRSATKRRIVLAGIAALPEFVPHVTRAVSPG